VVGEHEEVKRNLLVCSVGAGVARVGLPACEQELRARCGRWAAAVRRGRAAWGSWEEPAGQGRSI
jgi:hypothetical protein